MATIRKHYNSWQVIIRKKGHPHIYTTFASYSLAIQYAGESERAIAKGIFQDMSEANQTKLKDAEHLVEIMYFTEKNIGMISSLHFLN